MDVAHPNGVESSLVLVFFDTAKWATIVVFRICLLYTSDAADE